MIHFVCHFNKTISCVVDAQPDLSLLSVYNRPDKQKIQPNTCIVNIFLSISFNIYFGCSKEPFLRDALLFIHALHNYICFGKDINIFWVLKRDSSLSTHNIYFG